MNCGGTMLVGEFWKFKSTHLQVAKLEKQWSSVSSPRDILSRLLVGRHTWNRISKLLWVFVEQRILNVASSNTTCSWSKRKGKKVRNHKELFLSVFPSHVGWKLLLVSSNSAFSESSTVWKIVHLEFKHKSYIFIYRLLAWEWIKSVLFFFWCLTWLSKTLEL